MLQVQKYLILLCVILFTGEVWSTLQLRYESVPGARGWLRLHNTPATWLDALLRCTLEGGVLASPSSGAIVSAMKSKMAAQETTKVFIGIHAILSEEEYVSLDGIPVSNMPLAWAQGEPSNKDNSGQCLAMTDAGEVAVESCGSMSRYFCYKKDNKNLENKVKACCGCGYTLYPSIGSCYKFHTTRRTWLEADAACRAEGAHLAVINSYAEAEVLKNLFTSRPGYSNAIVLIGFRMERGNWMTIFGQTLAEAGFDKWSEGEPNNFGDRKEFCGSLRHNGELNDFACGNTDSAPFICENSSS